MKLPFLFEVMDLAWVPESLRITMRELLELACSMPPLQYYAWSARQAAHFAQVHGIENIIELGCGSAPLTRKLLEFSDLQANLYLADLHPDQRTFISLQQQGKGRVTPFLQPLDYSKPFAWPNNSLLLLSGTFHHIPPQLRKSTLLNLSSAKAVMVVEPLRKNMIAAFSCMLSIISALFLPLVFLQRQGFWRRALWCWFIPVAGIFLFWDGLVSCIRMYSDRQWKEEINNLNLQSPRKMHLLGTRLFQNVAW